MKRRTFFNWAGVGLLASYFPVALAACSNSGDGRTNAAAENFISLGTEAELESAGYLLNEESKVIVVRGREGIVALNPTCTHRGCTVAWNDKADALVCPCHNAKFAADGTVLGKPAVDPLATYEVKQENGEILVKLA